MSILRYGSCNAQCWAVHSNWSCAGVVGTALASGKALDFWARKNTVTDIGLLRATAPGQQWGWQYDALVANPKVRIIRNADSTIAYVWEAESPFDDNRPIRTPIPETDDYGTTIIPAGGSAVWLAGWPTASDFSALQSDVEAASLPSWITDTRWSDATDSVDLLKKLFRTEQSRIGGNRLYNTINDALGIDRSIEDYYEIMLVWLRCASRILYAHMGQTCIPLLLDKFYIDANGVLSLI